MKLNVRHVLIALVALVAGSVPAIALAQSGGFPPSTSAAGSQYGSTSTTTTTGTTTTGTTTTGTTTTGTTTTTPAGGQGGNGTPVTTPNNNGNGNSGNSNGNAGNGSNNGNGNNGNSGNNGNDNGGNAPSSSSGQAGNAAAAAAGASGAAGQDPRLRAPYATITLSPVNAQALQMAHLVTGVVAYDANVTEPMDTAAIKQLTTGTRWAGAEKANAKLAAFARALGKSVVNGGVLAKAALPKLATGVDAKYIHPMAGFVLIHTSGPLPGAAGKRRDAFIKNLVRGMKSTKVPTVDGGTMPVPLAGIEVSTQKPSTLTFFRSLGVSTIDNIDQASGRTSLSRVLAGAKGHFGVKKKVSPDGKVAKRPTGAGPLLYRPTASYTPGELLREDDGGLPGGGATAVVLLLVSLMSVVTLLAVIERRTRVARRKRSAV